MRSGCSARWWISGKSCGGVSFVHTIAPLFSASGWGVSGNTPKWPQPNVVSSSDASPNAHADMPSFSMTGWKSMTYSCSLETGISRPSAIAARTFFSTESSESAE